MKVSEAIDRFIGYHEANSKRTTIRNCEFLLTKFRRDFAEREIGTLTPEEILSFLTRVSQGTRQATRKLRFSLLRCFFNFTRTFS